MDLSRYEFEVLAYVEGAERAANQVREISDALCISGTACSQTLKKLLGEGMIAEHEDRLQITEAGRLALAPYQVHRAVIMAAGFGSRMMPATADRPKPLVSVNGKRIVETLIEALVAVGIQDITIVRGYKKERFDELLPKYPFLRLIDNDEYNVTNNISSAMAALKYIDHCYLCEADLYITNPKVITKYQYCSNILGSYALETDDWCFELANGHITNYRKGGAYCYNYYGISFWTEEDSRRLRTDFEQTYKDVEGGKDLFWEFIPLVLKHDDYQVEIRQCQKSDIMEIDNYYELAQLDPSYPYPIVDGNR